MRKLTAPHLLQLFLVIVFIASLIYFFSAYKKEPSFSLGANEFNLHFLEPGENEEEYLRSQMSVCYRNGTDACYRAVSELLNSQFDYQTLLALLEQGQNYPEIFGRCHEVTHFIGRAAYQKTPNIRTLYEHSSPSCWGGFYHGVIEAYFDERPYAGEEKFAEDIRAVCGTKDSYSVPRFFYECLHGIGHAMMFVSNDDLPKSLAWCDALPSSQEQSTCYGGVFMENSSSSTETGSKHESKYLKKDDILYPCSILEDKYLSICYQYQSSYFAQLVNYDWQKNGELCGKVPEIYQNSCFNIVGSNQVGATKDVVVMNKNCSLMPTDAAKKDCMAGVLGGLAGRYINEPKNSITYCNLVAEKFEQDCFNRLGGNFASWSTDATTLPQFCMMENKMHQRWCLDGLSAQAAFIAN